MASTRRTLLKTVGVAALASKLTKPAEAAPALDPRSLTLCNLAQGGLGVKQGDRILVVGEMSTDDVVAGRKLDRLQKALSAKGPSIAEKDAKFAPCILAPQKIVMLGYNYKKHVQERGVPTPKAPLLFNKYNNALNAHGGAIKLPVKAAKQFDYEVELQVIIGKRARDVAEKDALDHVFGYATGNDFSARDLQYRDGKSSQFMIGKTPDGFMPVGPWLVGAGLVPDPQKLRLETRVNGEQRQDSNTDDMIFTCAQIISYASQIFTLEPGDLISTGTPSGVILGMPEDKQVWLKAGDEVACSVEKLGELRFKLT